MTRLADRLMQVFRRRAEAPSDDWQAESAYWEDRLRRFCTDTYALSLDPLQADPKVVPPVALAALIPGTNKADLDGCFATGYRTTVSYLSELHDHGFDRQGMRRVLELGVGLGRLILHHLSFSSELHGCDVTPEVLAHTRNVVGHRVRCELTGLEPPLPYPDAHFDFVYANSVFTHVPCGSILGWEAELRRVTQPGGAVIVSVLDANHYLREQTSREFDEQFESRGCAEWATERGVMRMTYQSPRSVRDTWSKVFSLLEVRPHFRDQNHVICRRDV